jgi:uncharacterized membrane protein YkvA (DUF1232 family)
MEPYNARPVQIPATLVQRIARFLAQHPRWMLALAFIYLLSPVDLVPEVLLGPFGYLDDVIVLLLPHIIRSYVRRQDESPEVYDTTAE